MEESGDKRCGFEKMQSKFREFIHSLSKHVCVCHWAKLWGLMAKENRQVLALIKLIFRAKASVHRFSKQE